VNEEPAPLLNRDRARAFMRDSGLDALVATSPVNVRYVTGYWCWLDEVFQRYMVSPGGSDERVQVSLALLPADADPVLVVDALFAVNASAVAADVVVAGDAGFEEPEDGDSDGVPDDLRAVYELLERGDARRTPAESLVTAIKARGLAEAVLGVELSRIPSAVRDRLEQDLPRAQLRDCSNLLRLVRAVKSEEELVRLERSAWIAEQAAQASFAQARDGSTLGELADAFGVAAAEHGAGVDHYALGPRGLGITTERHVTLRPGDTMFADFGCTYRGYFSDSGTTLSVGEPGTTVRRRFEALRATIAAGVETMRPGVRASAVQESMRATLADHGITASYPHGHGFGLLVRDYPIVAPDNGSRVRDDCVDVPSDLTLEAGMVVNLEVPVFSRGSHSIHNEQSFVVTDAGSRPLTEQPRDAPCVVT
jgi:Xaa-Pro aminopeptidase